MHAQTLQDVARPLTVARVNASEVPDGEENASALGGVPAESAGRAGKVRWLDGTTRASDENHGRADERTGNDSICDR